MGNVNIYNAVRTFSKPKWICQCSLGVYTVLAAAYRDYLLQELWGDDESSEEFGWSSNFIYLLGNFN